MTKRCYLRKVCWVLDGVPIGVIAAIATYITASPQYAAHAGHVAGGAGGRYGQRLRCDCAARNVLLRRGFCGRIEYFLTTSTDIVSIGLLLGLTALMVR